MPSDAPTSGAAAAAAILESGEAGIDARFAAFVERQREAGLVVEGVVMTFPEGRTHCKGAMVLVDVRGGEAFTISQDLGAGSTACRLDPRGVAAASRVLREARARGAELVVVNRFGGLEAAGSGFAQELLELMTEGTPVLTIVAQRHLDAWRRFSGDAPVLPDDPAAWAAWLAGVRASPRPGARHRGDAPA